MHTSPQNTVMSVPILFVSANGENAKKWSKTLIKLPFSFPSKSLRSARTWPGRGEIGQPLYIYTHTRARVSRIIKYSVRCAPIYLFISVSFVLFCFRPSRETDRRKPARRMNWCLLSSFSGVSQIHVKVFSLLS